MVDHFDELDVINRQIHKRQQKSPEGTIVSVNVLVAYVQRAGSSQIIPCAYDPRQGVEVGKRCAYRRIPGRKSLPYVIESVFGARNSIASGDQNKASFELAPPANLQAASDVGAVLLTWDCPPQRKITFELQFNTSASEEGAATFRTSGGQFRYPTDTETYYRIRSITEDWRFSSWTAWGSAEPGEAGGGGSGTDENAIHVNVAGEIDGLTDKTALHLGDDFLIEDAEAGNAKKKIAWTNIVKSIKDALFNTFFQVTAGLAKNYTGSSGIFQISLNLPGLTEDTTPDGAADFLVTYDASASTHKKVKPDNLPTPSMDLDDLGDVDTSGASDGDVLTYDSGAWVAQAPAGDGGASVLDDLTDVDTSGVSNGDVLTYDSGAWVAQAPASGGGALDVIHLRELQSSGTNGGDFNSGAWQTRTLNYEWVDTGSHCTLSSNQFTLDAGNYRMYARVPAWGVDHHQARLQNISDGGTTLGGTNEYAPSTGSLTASVIVGRFVIGSPKTFEIQHRCATTMATYGFGLANSFGVAEIYTEVWIEKE